MKFVAVLVLLLAVCGADIQATWTGTWRLTYAVRGWTGTRGATGQEQAWALLQHGRQQISSTMLHWDGVSWRTAVLPRGVSAYNAKFAVSPAGDDLWLFSGNRPFQLSGGRWVYRPWTSGYDRGRCCLRTRRRAVRMGVCPAIFG